MRDTAHLEHYVNELKIKLTHLVKYERDLEKFSGPNADPKLQALYEKTTGKITWYKEEIKSTKLKITMNNHLIAAHKLADNLKIERAFAEELLMHTERFENAKQILLEGTAEQRCQLINNLCENCENNTFLEFLKKNPVNAKYFIEGVLKDLQNEELRQQIHANPQLAAFIPVAKSAPEERPQEAPRAVVAVNHTKHRRNTISYSSTLFQGQIKDLTDSIKKAQVEDAAGETSPQQSMGT